MDAINELRKALSYDSLTGEFRWLLSPARQVPIGSVAGSLHHEGYIVIFYRRRRYLAHRLVWAFVHGEWPAGQIDHRDRVRANNAIANLRDVTGTVNKQNMSHAQSNSKTGILGVSPRGSRFVATIQVNRRQKYLGLFDTAQQASDAYQAAKRQHHAESA